MADPAAGPSACPPPWGGWKVGGAGCVRWYISRSVACAQVSKCEGTAQGVRGLLCWGVLPPLGAPSTSCYELCRTVLLFMSFTLKFYSGPTLLETRRLLA